MTDDSHAPRVRRKRRLFAVGSHLFRFNRARLTETIMDGIGTCIEAIIYIIGPFLIMLALWIIGVLVYSFATIMVPMMIEKHAGNPYASLIVGLHGAVVLFLVANILFNYAMAVTTKHKGAHYDAVVRELAVATDLVYPETPAQVAQFHHDFEDRMMLRMKRRQARGTNATAAASTNGGLNGNGATANGNMTHRTRKGASSPPQPTTPAAPAPPVRSWMLLGPMEWGYCRTSNQPKPPRSHYDHVTQLLVLNLDHYCPWMFNAIGYFNYRYFVSFLIYVGLGMMYGAVLSSQPFLLLSSREYKTHLQYQRTHGGTRPEHRAKAMVPFRDEKMLITLCFMLCAAVGLAVLLLGGFHVYLTLTGQTTIEFHANWANRRRARRMGQKWSNPYSLGSAKANWEQVFGKCIGWSGIVLSLLPSLCEPDFLPVPISGHPGRKKKGSIKVPPPLGGESIV